MRRADGEPERSGSADPPRRRRDGRFLVPLVIAGAAVVVLSTAAEGRAHLTPLGAADPDPMQLTPAPIPSGAGNQPHPNLPTPGVDSTVLTVLTVLACIVALAVAALLIRFIVSAIRARRRRPGRSGLHAAGAEAGPEIADAPAVLRGIAAALAAFDGDREPHDAVVQAWLGLQQAAEDAGFARSLTETPTEFTGRVLSRTGADRIALRSLLRLYLRARFGDGAISPADATDARDALRALEASWQRPATGSVVAGRP